jgi:hypothetical protein
MFRFDRALLARLCLVTVPLCCAPFVGCSDSEDDDDAAAGGLTGLEGYEDVAYEGDTTDEALVSLVAALEQGTVEDPARSAVLDAPVEEVPAAPPPTFTWHVGAESRGEAPSGARHAALPPAEPEPGPGLRLLELPAPRPGTPLELALQAALSGVPSAHAHGDPFNGHGTLLSVTSSSNPKLARVFTGASTWTPSAAVWQAIVEAGGTLTVTLVGADFDQNRIAEGGGPFEGSTTTFTIAP